MIDLGDGQKMNGVTFIVVDANDNSMIYKCEKSWRVFDFKNVYFQEDSFDIIVETGDVGTITYKFNSGTWN
jgi:hypothetical protein